MAKDFENVDKIIKDTAKKNKFDINKESYKWATMSISELTKEFSKIEERNDKKLKEINDLRNKVYQDQINAFTRNAELYKKLVLDSTDKDDKANWAKHYMDNDIKLQALFDSINAKLDEKEVRLEQEKKKEKQERILMFVAKAAIPIIVNAVANGVSYYLTQRTSSPQQLPNMNKPEITNKN